MREQVSAHDEVTIALDAAQPTGAGVGVVIETGERCAQLRGKRVLVAASDPCGDCDVCRAGSPAACPSAVRHGPPTRKVRAASRWLVELGDGLELPLPAAAAVAGDLATAYTIYARANLAPRDPVIVVGCNAVARFVVDILVAKSISPVVVVEDRSTAWGAELATRGIAVATADLPEQVAAALASQGVAARPRRVVATETSAIAAACTLAGPRAILAVVADRAFPSLPGEVFAREVSAVGIAGPHPDLILEAAAMCVRGDVDLPRGVTEDPTDRTRAVIIRASNLG